MKLLEKLTKRKATSAQKQAREERLLQSMEEMVRLMAKAQADNAAVMHKFLGMFEVKEAPQPRMNGDDYQLTAAEVGRMERLGYPTKGSERERLHWLWEHMDEIGNRRGVQ